MILFPFGVRNDPNNRYPGIRAARPNFFSTNTPGGVVEEPEPQTATPVISPASGTFGSPFSATITCSTPGATIYYTDDGSTPSSGSTPYTVPIDIVASITIKAIAVTEGYVDSNIDTAVYVIGGGSNVVLEDSFTGSGSFAEHPPEVGSWNIAGDWALTGDGRLQAPQSIMAGLNSPSLVSGRFEALLEMEFDSGFTNTFDIEFNVDNDVVTTQWKLVISGASIVLNEVTDGTPTQRGSYSFPGGTTSADIRFDTSEDDGDTINVYVNDVLRITYTAVGRLGKDNTDFTLNSDILGFNFYLNYVLVTDIP